ncbi:hypothetical protein F5Y16DRAFT_271689 [Xylariaceae sp. FL0255]|nr:hypothetical protein F5Y16DRAFT_271689 [Xylariaceae sp. FL0255]
MDGARKIELQAPEDLAYLLANVRRAGAAQIDQAFPPIEDNSEDELRTRIEAIVNEYINNTFALAAPNLSINGLPVDTAQFQPPSSSPSRQEPNEVFESFDARKREKVEALTAEEEDLLRDIAHLKKSVPGSVASAWAEASRKGIKDDEDALVTVNEKTGAAITKTTSSGLTGEESTSANGHGVTIIPLERQDDVEQSFEDAMSGLGKLKEQMPVMAARMERALKASEYVVTGR